MPRFVFESVAQFSSNGQEFVQKLEGDLRRLEQAARQSIRSTGSGAGVSQQLATFGGRAAGTAAALAQQGQLTPAEMNRAERLYIDSLGAVTRRLQREAAAVGSSVADPNPATVGKSQAAALRDAMARHERAEAESARTAQAAATQAKSEQQQRAADAVAEREARRARVNQQRAELAAAGTNVSSLVSDRLDAVNLGKERQRVERQRLADEANAVRREQAVLAPPQRPSRPLSTEQIEAQAVAQARTEQEQRAADAVAEREARRVRLNQQRQAIAAGGQSLQQLRQNQQQALGFPGNTTQSSQAAIAAAQAAAQNPQVRAAAVAGAQQSAAASAAGGQITAAQQAAVNASLAGTNRAPGLRGLNLNNILSGLPAPGQQQALQQFLAAGAARDQALANAAKFAGQQRELGLRTGLAEEQEFRSRDLKGDPTALAARRAQDQALINQIKSAGTDPDSDLGIRTRLTAIRREREVRESTADEQARLGDKELQQATAKLAAVLRERQIVEEQAARAARDAHTTGVIDPNTGKARSLNELEARNAAEVQAAKALQTRRELEESKGNVALLANTRAAEQARAQAIRASTAADLSANKQYIEDKAKANLAERELARAIREETIRQSGGAGGGSLFQRLQAFVASRSGAGGVGGGGDRLPEEFQTFGKFFTSKALTTGGFALSGALLYGVVSGFKDIVHEASQLQDQLSFIKARFDALGDTAGFHRLTQQIVDISKETGVTAEEVALVARQLAGVFTDPITGAADFTKALSETQDALKLSQVTGLPTQEITDSLTAITTTFGTSFKSIGDTSIGLEQRFGVLSTNIIQFTADLAPTAKALGFTVEQIAALGAIAQQRSGVSGTALAENFNRSLPAIRENQGAIAALLSQSKATVGYADPIIQALGQGEGAKVITELTRAYGAMTDTQRNALGEMLGGQKNAKAFFAVLGAGKETIDALNSASPSQFAGSLDQRFAEFSKTVTFALEQARRKLEEFGLALFNSGIGDGLRDIAQAGGLAATALTALLGWVGDLNDATGGLIGRLVAMALAIKAIQIAVSTGSGIKGFVTSIAQGAAAAGGTQAALAAGATGATGASTAGLSTGAASLISSTNAANAGVALVPGGAAALTGRLATVYSALAPLLAAALVADAVSTYVDVRAATDNMKQELNDKIVEQVKAGTDPQKIIQSYKGAGDPSTASLGGLASEEIKNLVPFGNAGGGAAADWALGWIDIPNPFGGNEQGALDNIQRANAPVQLQQLDAIIGKASDADKKKLQKLRESFANDPANNAINDVVARIIAQKQSEGGDLASVLDDYAKGGGSTRLPEPTSAAADFAPVIAEIEARYQVGQASLTDLLAAQRHGIEIAQKTLASAISGGDPDAIQKAAADLKSQQGSFDQTISQAAQRAENLQVKLAGYKGGDAVAAKADAALARLNTVISQGASPDVQADAAFNAADALNSKLDQFINSPVITNGIARAPSAAEKLARATQGIEIPPELRAAIIRGTLLVNNATQLANIAGASGTELSQVIDAYATLQTTGDAAAINAIKAAVEQQLADLIKLQITLKHHGEVDPDTKAKIAQAEQALADLKAVPDATAQADPGTTIIGDLTGLKDAAALDAASEAKAFAEAMIAQQRARAHGDPVAVAQAALDAARTALAFADPAKPSEAAAAIAQLIDAQNQMDDAQAAIVQARISLLQAITGDDPVNQANLQRAAADTALANAHGEAAQLAAVAQQAQAAKAIRDAIRDVIASQIDLLIAVADAAGKTVEVAQLQLQKAQAALANALADRAAGNDPGEKAINDLKAKVIQAQAGVRDTELQSREQDIDFALQMEQITTQQAISQLQALLQIPNLTKQETQDILLKIKQLKDQLGGDFQFNLPTEFRLPTSYEARRLNQGGVDNAGLSSYQDNRTFVISVSTTSGATADQIAAAIGSTIDATVGNPRRFATVDRIL